ncbi:hypothetical protein CY35_01G112100 [Sphagnum magellanicum]|nr:hypothetical protein CY35_01G112100 [Sphagnum magellanicum]KAH9575453.1 hypothetical protein CY35_01G112100 [Sphagnum magellanicum]KAH9575454.1 hypothetical protein CY35_01G112100 [Sphagnum magellanicum]
MSEAGDYVHFKARVPLHHIPIGSSGTKHWRFYDFGPKSVPPLVCLSGVAGSADIFYKQILFLSAKGYRVIAADAPAVWNHLEWVSSFEKFLDALGVHQVHLYGTSLGGFLAQLFAQYRPRRVKSLLLSNTFLDNWDFEAIMPWASLISWTPEFLLKRYILSGIQDGPQEPSIADSIDFVVKQTNDYCAVPSFLKEKVSARYPGGRRALLKSGGDFPFLSRADEVNLHAQLHLRRVGVEGQPQLTPKNSLFKERIDKSSSGEESLGVDKDYKKKGIDSDLRQGNMEGQPQLMFQDPMVKDRSKSSSTSEEILEADNNVKRKGVGGDLMQVGVEGQPQPPLKNLTFTDRSSSSFCNEETLEKDEDFTRKGVESNPLQHWDSENTSPVTNGSTAGERLN